MTKLYKCFNLLSFLHSSLKKIALLTAFLSGIVSAPFFFFSDSTTDLSHASANMAQAFNFLPEEEVSYTVADAVALLETSEKIIEIQNPELCGKAELFADLSESEKEILKSAWKDIPCELLQNLKKVVIFDDMEKPRALAGASALHLRSDIFTLSEVQKVLIHESGHLVDLGGLQSQTFSEKSAFVDGSMPVFADDASADFYAISWKATDAWNADTTVQDFVSRYGATDPFEDFAESFLFYISYGEAFRQLAAENDQLAQKYDFFKTQVFDGKEFDGEMIVVTAERPWDATRI